MDTIKSDLLAAVVNGPFETPLWKTFLDQLRTGSNADYVGLNLRPSDRPFEEEVSLLSAEGNLSLESVNIDDFPGEPPADESLIEGRLYSFDELLAKGDPQTVAYLSFIKSDMDIGCVRQMRIQELSGVNAWLSILRMGEADFQPEEEALMKCVADILRSTLRLFVAVERERLNAMLGSDLARRMQFGWLLLDSSGCVLDCDDQGKRALKTTGVLSWKPNGRLCAASTKLENEIYRTINRMAANSKSRPHAMTLCQDPWFDMLLLPTNRKSIAAKAAPAVIAYIHGDNWSSSDRCEQLSQLFRLSPQESRLALALCRGRKISEAASDLGVSVDTTRNYLKSIYGKSGARGQSDLVRILMRSVLAIAPDI